MMTFTNGKYGVYASQIWCLQGANHRFVFLTRDARFVNRFLQVIEARFLVITIYSGNFAVENEE